MVLPVPSTQITVCTMVLCAVTAEVVVHLARQAIRIIAGFYSGLLLINTTYMHALNVITNHSWKVWSAVVKLVRYYILNFSAIRIW